MNIVPPITKQSGFPAPRSVRKVDLAVVLILDLCAASKLVVAADCG